MKYQPPYFCVCFICGSMNICPHRERELVVWWLSDEAVLDKGYYEVIIEHRPPRPAPLRIAA